MTDNSMKVSATKRSFMDVWKALGDGLTIIAAAMILFGLAAFLISKFAIKPVYESTSSVYVFEDTFGLTSDINGNSKLPDDYASIVVSTPVLEDAISELKLEKTIDDVRKAVKVVNPKNSRILNITVRDTDPEEAKKLAYELAFGASSYMNDTLDMKMPMIIEEGVESEKPVLPNTLLNCLLAVIIGGLLAVLGITIRTLLNDTINNSDDVNKYLGLPVLATIPEKPAEKKD